LSKTFTTPKYFEELKVGDVFMTPGRTVMECDVRECSALAGLFEEIFSNHEYAMKESVFKARIAQGPLTLIISFGLGLQAGWMHGTVQALLGIDQMRVPRPTYVNDTIHMEIEVAETKETRSKPAGVVTTRNTVFNQRKEPVLTYFTRLLIAKRPVEAAVLAE